jgi:hypothetical protein
LLNTTKRSGDRFLRYKPNWVRTPGLVAAPVSPPSRRPAQRGRGAWHRNNKKVLYGTKTLANTTSTPPRVTGSAGVGRRRFGLIRRANSHDKGQHERPVLPERVCGSGATDGTTVRWRSSPHQGEQRHKTPVWFSVKILNQADEVSAERSEAG